MKKREKTIFVTGSTGFLGSAVTLRLLTSGYKLKLLIRRRDCDLTYFSRVWESIIGETVSANNMGEFVSEMCGYTDTRQITEEMLYDLFLKNVEIVAGDITSGGLGLEEREYRRLCYEVDDVFHCAAATHFEKQRAEEIMAVNVKGTENMLYFSGSGKKKRFHYVSTAYIAGRQDTIVFEEEMATEPVFNNEYEKSKYIAEKIVINYAESNDIPYKIYRPAIIVGDSRTGATCRFDNLYTFAKALYNIESAFIDQQSKDMNAITIRVPGDPDALINLVPVDFVADSILAILEDSECDNKIYHIINPDPPKLRELRDLLMSVLDVKGLRVKIDGELDYSCLSTLERLFLRQTKTYYAYLFSRLRFDCTNTLGILSSRGVSCPVISKDIIRVLVDFAISRNWGAKRSGCLAGA